MSTTKMFALLVLAVLLPKVNANGQQKFQFTFHGTSWTTNETGRFISKPANNKTLLQEYALLTHGTNNLKNLTLAYHYRGDEHGDVVEVVNAKDGTTIYPLFGLFFSDEYGRMSLLSGTSNQEQSIDYIYTHQMDHSAGSSVTTKRLVTDKSGKTKAVAIQGQLYYDIVPDNTHSNMQILNGTFITGKLIGRQSATNLPTHF
jgi:hypothetical protein